MIVGFNEVKLNCSHKEGLMSILLECGCIILTSGNVEKQILENLSVR